MGYTSGRDIKHLYNATKSEVYVLSCLLFWRFLPTIRTVE